MNVGITLLFPFVFMVCPICYCVPWNGVANSQGESYSESNLTDAHRWDKGVSHKWFTKTVNSTI